MQTNFSLAQLNDPDIAASNDILRKCVHCGFCTATCPTYVLSGDELDSPRGRIYLMKQAFESGEPATGKLVKHIDRCLSCLSCLTTCPASVDYMHLVDHGRAYIEKTYRRPLPDRAIRALLALVLPSPAMFRLSLIGAKLGRPFARILPGRLGAMLDLAPKEIPAPSSIDVPQVFKPEGPVKRRVALLTGCAQQVLRPAINEATVRLLTRLGCEVVIAESGCCGALVHHMGREDAGHAAAKTNIAAWERAEAAHGRIDDVVINASGCGTTVKDYGWMLRNDDAWAGRAEAISQKTRDVTEVLTALGVDGASAVPGIATVAYHSACSMQHGQQLKTEPVALLKNAGFEVVQPTESHLCCGSAGTYNIMQPKWAAELGRRKAGSLKTLGADVIVTGNIGCLTQISGVFAGDEGPPVVHTVELLDWATGGPPPPEFARS